MTDAKLYDSQYFQNIRGTKKGQELHLKFLPIVRGDEVGDLKLLDLGCGQGQLLELLDQDPTLKVYGLDFSSSAVEVSRQLLGDEERVICGSAADPVHFQPGTFDIICMMDVVEHLPPDALGATLSNARLWLKPSGRLVIHTFPTLTLHRLYQTFLKLTGQRDALALLDQIHCNVQTRSRLRTAVETAGFQVGDIWLQNDFTLTSSAYQRLSDGLIKKVIGFVLDHIMGNSFVQAVCDKLGLLELVSPSIYCVARPQP